MAAAARPPPFPKSEKKEKDAGAGRATPAARKQSRKDKKAAKTPAQEAAADAAQASTGGKAKDKEQEKGKEKDRVKEKREEKFLNAVPKGHLKDFSRPMADAYVPSHVRAPFLPQLGADSPRWPRARLSPGTTPGGRPVASTTPRSSPSCRPSSWSCRRRT